MWVFPWEREARAQSGKPVTTAWRSSRCSRSPVLSSRPGRHAEQQLTAHRSELLCALPWPLPTQDGHGMLGELAAQEAGQAILRSLRDGQLRHKQLKGARAGSRQPGCPLLNERLGSPGWPAHQAARLHSSPLLPGQRIRRARMMPNTCTHCPPRWPAVTCSAPNMYRYGGRGGGSDGPSCVPGRPPGSPPGV